MLNRIQALIVKETLAVLRDPRNRVALIVPPLLQLMLFAFTATLEVKNINLAVLNEDYGQISSELIQVSKFKQLPEYPVCRVYGCSSRSD